MKRLLNLPQDTNILWKSHDYSIAQRTAIDQARHEKATANHHPGSDRRRGPPQDDSRVKDHNKPAAS